MSVHQKYTLVCRRLGAQSSVAFDTHALILECFLYLTPSVYTAASVEPSPELQSNFCMHLSV